MATTSERVVVVKEALKGATASQSTVSELQDLLAAQSKPTPVKRPQASQNAARTGKPTSSRNGNSNRKTAVTTTVVLEDSVVDLTAREKYALATDSANACLKLLTDSLKSSQNRAKDISSRTQKEKSTAQTSLRSSSVSQRALQPCSGNGTAAASSPEKENAARRTSSLLTDTSSNIVATAECARIAFSYLRSADLSKAAAREMPRLHLENGMLALVSKLIGHGLDNLAIKELRTLKRVLESEFPRQNPVKAARNATSKPSLPEKETLASLMQLHVSLDADSGALAVAIGYYLHVLKIIATSRKPAVIENISPYLQIEHPSSVVDLILTQSKEGGDTTKAAKQLDTLSQTILTLCPSISSSADDTATDLGQSPSPAAVLELQTLALRIRRRWWSLSKHQPDIPKELIEPFGKCVTAFLRRTPDAKDSGSRYDFLAKCFELLGPIDRNSADAALFNMHCLLATRAEEANKYTQALEWAEQMSLDCASLEENHVRRLIYIVHNTALLLRLSASAIQSLDVSFLVGMLQKKLAGTNADYDLLLPALAGLTQVLEISNTNIDRESSIRLAGLAAGLSLRYFGVYPGKNTPHIQSILHTALRLGKSADDLFTWVNDYSAKVFLQANDAQDLVYAAARKPLSVAWTVSGSAVSLSRILRALVLRTVRNAEAASPTVFDDEALDADLRGLVLENQLEYTLELAPKTKYHRALGKIVPELLEKLSAIYTAGEFPIRRARVAVTAFKLAECIPELLPTQIFKTRQDASLSHSCRLGKDVALQDYLVDIKAGFDIARAFSHGRPAVSDLIPALKSWQSIVDSCESGSKLRERIENPSALVRLLGSIAVYLSMLGEDHMSLATHRLTVKLTQVTDDFGSMASLTLVNMAKQYLQLGYAEKAEYGLTKAKDILDKGQGPLYLVQLQYQLVHAECLLQTDRLDECRTALEKAQNLRSDMDTSKMSQDDRRTCELLHAHNLMVRSKYLLETSRPHDSLAAAKRSVRILNGMWSSLERRTSHQDTSIASDCDESLGEGTEAVGLTKGISKLRLTPNQNNSSSKSPPQGTKGAVFWSIVPLLCRSLLHLSDMYTHHGIFNESNYHSECAVRIAQSVGSDALLSRVKTHKSRLLVLADRVEEASLYLAQDDIGNVNAPSQARVERLCAQAAICEKETSFDEAVLLYEKAADTVKVLQSKDLLKKLERFDDGIEQLERGMGSMSLSVNPKVEGNTGKSQGKNKIIHAPPRGRGVAHRPDTKKDAVSKTTSKRDAETEATEDSCYLFEKLAVEIAIRKMFVKLKSTGDIQSALDEIDASRLTPTLSLQRRLVQCRELMRKAVAALDMDVTLNILAESTLSYPAVAIPNHDQPKRNASRPEMPTGGKSVPKFRAKTKRTEATAGERFGDLLNAARECLLKDYSNSIQSSGTMQSHVESTMLVNVTLLLSAVSSAERVDLLHPINDSLVVDLPRIKALEYEQRVIDLDEAQADTLESSGSSNTRDNHLSTHALSAATFREQFVDILPESWTAVSLSLSEDASELYLARYHCGQTPLILRLPFSRNKDEGLDEEPFDYHKGKAELQDIIRLSNYTCHSTGSVEAKGAKTKWWNEREALDRRMHELLINIENIWIGGFRGVFSQHPRRTDLVADFRKLFEDILNTHLPSRNASKGRAEKLSINDELLELFIGLGHDENGSMDLDEPIADLCYFVVDMLQFNGERNAYDEIDFDSMSVEILDALRSYHQKVEVAEGAKDQHLILVLDKRLQSFPWESLPCLEEASVSRVGSMLTLRERVLAMRPSQGASSGDAKDRHFVKRTSGTYILNPSSNLPGTQTMLGPVLSRLHDDQAGSWTAIVNEEPQESRFASALDNSSMLMYFGHGAGSQYIRPRTIKRLNRCCDVVWLMGCSSGAVDEYGEFEPSAVPLAYLLAGQNHGEKSYEEGDNCKAIVATLWDVTDKDIDRFSLALGEEWGLWQSSEQSKVPMKTPKKPRTVEAPSTPRQPPKTPKTPKPFKSPAPMKTPARRQKGPEQSQKQSLVTAVSRSRDACYLRYLNGAAPVVYGVPVYLAD